MADRERACAQEWASRPAAGPRAAHGRDPRVHGWTLGGPCRPRPSPRLSPLELEQRCFRALLGLLVSGQRDGESAFSAERLGEITALRCPAGQSETTFQNYRCGAVVHRRSDSAHTATQERTHDGRAGDGSNQDAHQLHKANEARAPLKVRPLHSIYRFVSKAEAKT